MFQPFRVSLAVLTFMLFSFCLAAQTDANFAPESPAVRSDVPGVSVPRLVKFSGVLRDAEGKVATGSHYVTFSLYAEQSSSTPLWTETQKVVADENGRYGVTLGSTLKGGIPISMFSNGEARWLEMSTVGEVAKENGAAQRLMLVSVPFALKAEDADKLGGRAATDFVLSSELEQQVAKAVSQQAGKAGQAYYSPDHPISSTVQDLAPNGAARFQDTSVVEVVVVQQNGTGFGLNVIAINGSAIRAQSAGVGAGNATILGQATSATGSPVAVQGESVGPTGIGVQGVATNIAATNVGVRGEAAGSTGRGVVGVATGSGATTGVLGSVTSSSGTGVRGDASGAGGTAVLGNASGTTGSTIGVQGEVSSAGGRAGVFRSNNGAGKVLVGQGPGPTDVFTVDAGGNVSASGTVTATGGLTTNGPLTVNSVSVPSSSSASGLLKATNSGAGAAVEGLAAGTSNAGVYGRSIGAAGVGVLGESGAAGGTAGVFNNTAGGKILSGLNNGTEIFNVMGSGNDIVSVLQSAAGGAFPISTPQTVPTAIYGEGSSLTGATSGVVGVTNANLSSAGVVGVATNVTALDSNNDPTGVAGISFSDNGGGVYAAALHPTGNTTGIDAQVESPNGVAGRFENTAGGQLISGVNGSGEVFKVNGDGSVNALGGVFVGPNGGIFARDTINDGTTRAGSQGISDSNNGRGVTGTVPTTGAGNSIGVLGVANADNSAGVFGRANSATGTTSGSRGINFSQNGWGVRGDNYPPTLDAAISNGVGVLGTYGQNTNFTTNPNASNGVGVNGKNFATNGTGVKGEASADGGVGVDGAASGPNSGRGVRGNVFSLAGFGVEGVAQNTGGSGIGVNGITNANNSGAGVRAEATTTTGNSVAFTAINNGPGNVANLFALNSGKLISGNNIGGEVFSVSNTGAVTSAGVIRSTAGGIQFPDNTIQTTAAGAGSGVSTNTPNALVQRDGAGSFAAQNITANSFIGTATNASSLGGVLAANYARLDQNNTFTGLQSVSGNTPALSSSIVNVTQAGSNATPADINNLPPAAISGTSTALTNFSIGVLGKALSQDGTGVIGISTSAISGSGVVGVNNGVADAAVVGESLATSGNGRGIYGKANSPAGTAGLFRNFAAGNLIEGRDGSGTLEFSVNSVGNVSANGTITAASFTGDGSGLTNITAATATNATSATNSTQLGGIAAATYARLDQAQTFNGTQTVAGNVTLTGATATVTALGGVFQGVGGGVFGRDTTATGNTVGVQGISDSTSGVGVSGRATAATGATNGVFGRADSTNGAGVFGQATATSGVTAGVRGTSLSPSGKGTEGDAFPTTANAVTANGIGVLGTYGFNSDFSTNANATGGYGVLGRNVGAGNFGVGVKGEALSATGVVIGVSGDTASNAGLGVQGLASNATGNTVGVRGVINSPAGVAGLFESNDLGGMILRGYGNGVQKFGVDAIGNVAATGTVTAAAFVGDGSGLTGISSSGASTSSINTFTANQNFDANLNIATTSGGAAGVITQNSVPFIHSFGSSNAFFGKASGNFTMTGSGNVGLGEFTLFSNTTGSFNSAIGSNALSSNTTGSNSIAIGSGALAVATTGISNIAVGVNAQGTNLSGLGNIAIGESALYFNTAGNQNVAIGYSALINTTADNNTALGVGAGQTNATGTNNTFLGYNANADSSGLTNATAVGANVMVTSDNTVILGSGANVGIGTTTPSEKLEVSGNILASGTVAASAFVGDGSGLTGLSGATTGSANTFTADQSFSSNINLAATSASSAGVITQNGNPFLHSFGTNNTFLGAASGNFSLTGDANTGIGAEALQSLTSGVANTATGYGALRINTSGIRNAAFGYQTLSTNTSGNENTAVGMQALQNQTTANDNTAIGSHAMRDNVTGINNTALGAFALQSNTISSGNTALGWSALTVNSSSANTAVGTQALFSNTTGQSNTALGYLALPNNAGGSFNVAVGVIALNNTTGGGNVGVGRAAGSVNTTGTSNTFLGEFADASSNNLTNATAIGASAVVGQSNAIVLGNGADVGIGTSTPTEKLDVTGNGRFSGSLVIGGGQAIAGHLSASGTITYSALAAGSCDSSQTVAVTGAVVGNAVSVGINAALASATSFMYMGYVSASGTVTIRACNIGAGPNSPTGTVKVDVWQ